MGVPPFEFHKPSKRGLQQRTEHARPRGLEEIDGRIAFADRSPLDGSPNRGFVTSPSWETSFGKYRGVGGFVGDKSKGNTFLKITPKGLASLLIMTIQNYPTYAALNNPHCTMQISS